MGSSKCFSAFALAVVFLMLTISLSASVATSNPMTPVRHHRPRPHARTRMAACSSYLFDSLQIPPKAHLEKPSQACCRRYLQIFSSEDPTMLCIYMHPWKLKTSINIKRLLSLHDLCGGPVSLYDICSHLGHPEGSELGLLSSHYSANQ